MVQLQELIHSDSPSVRQWPGFKAVARDEFVLGASWERGLTCKGKCKKREKQQGHAKNWKWTKIDSKANMLALKKKGIIHGAPF